MYETLLIDGVDVSSAPACIQTIDGLYITPSSRGDNIVIPGVDGEVYVPKSFESGTVVLNLVLVGTSTTGFNDAYRRLRTIVKPGQRVLLTRRLSFSTGYEEHTAWGEYLSGLEPELALARVGKTALTMRVHSGLWFSSNIISTSAGTITVAGEARTRRMTIVAGPGTISNLTTGHTFTYSGTGTATIDVEAMTAHEGATDTSSKLVWNKTYPFELAPGTNSISGSATIQYRAAYL